MSLKINVTDKALEDAIGIANYLANQLSFNTSDKFLNVTTQAYRQLADMPGMGATRDYGPEFPGLRVWSLQKFSKYLIFYQTTETELTILRVIHSARNIEQLFNPSDNQ